MAVRPIAVGRLLLLGAGVSACSTFGSDSPPDAVDGGTDASGATTNVDAAAPPAPGNTKAYVVVAAENARVSSVAVDHGSIYWWSVQDTRIATVAKTALGAPRAFAVRAGATATAVVATSSGVYWTEDTLSGSAGTLASRLFLQPPASASAELVTTANAGTRYDALAFGPGGPVTSSSDGVTVFDGGTAQLRKVGIEGARGLADDGLNVFYAFTDSLFRVSHSGQSTKVMQNLGTFHEIVVDDRRVYVIGKAVGSNVPILAVDKNANQADSTTAVAVAVSNETPTKLALDGKGNLVFATAEDGIVHRVPTAGGAVEQVATGVAKLNGLAADADGVYWTTDDGQVGWARR